jgi:hypothetical protein
LNKKALLLGRAFFIVTLPLNTIKLFSMFKQKLKASFIHLGLSIILVALLIGSILFFWFPQLFIGVTEFKEVASIIISVDLVLGPLLTFVVFQPQKKTLTFDLSVIISIQLIALTYGVYALYQIHPVYITFTIDRFTIVNARDAEPKKSKYKEYNISKFSSATLAYAKMPEEREKRNDVTMTAAFGGKDLEQRVEYYKPYKTGINEILLKSLDPTIIFSKNNPTDESKLFLEKFGNTIENYAFLPLNSMSKDAIIVLDKKTADAVAMIDIDPWTLK